MASLRCFAFVAAVVLLRFQDARAEKDLTEKAVVARVVADFQARQRNIRTVHCVAAGTMTTGKGAHTGEPGSPPNAVSPSRDVTCEVKRDWLIDFERGMIRKAKWHPVWIPAKQEHFLRYEVDMFDGSTVRVLRPKAENTTSQYTPDRLEPELLLYFEKRGAPMLWDIQDLPVYLAHGLLFCSGQLLRDLKRPVDGSLIRVLAITPPADGHGLGRAMIQVRDPAAGADYQYEVDLDRQSAVVSATNYWLGKPSFRLEVQHQETKHGWLPEKWTTTVLTQPGTVKSVVELKMTEYQVNLRIDGSQFTVDPRPGTVVQNLDQRSYLVGDRGELSPVLPERLAKDTGPTSRRDSRLLLRSAWLAMAIAAILVVVFRIRKRNSLQETQAPDRGE